MGGNRNNRVALVDGGLAGGAARGIFELFRM